MAPEKSPAFQFYPKEFLMDGNVAAMSLQERGAYITLLCICWQERSLPVDLTRLANIVGLPVKVFQKLWPSLSPCFLQQGDRLLHPRLEKERGKQEAHRQRQSDKGIASAAARANHKPTGTPPNGNHGSTTVQPEPQPKANSPVSDLRSPISEKTEREPPERLDIAWHEFCRVYPQDRVERGRIVNDGFIAACLEVGTAEVFSRLDGHKRSAQWRKGMVPKMGNYFGEKQLWKQELPEIEIVSGAKPAVDVTELARARVEANDLKYGKR